MTKLITVALAAALASTTALADNLLVHNGSLMNATQNEVGIVRIKYLDPRPSLKAIGIFPGVLLIEGRWIDPGHFQGFANVFACGISWPYEVQGGIAPDGVTLLLQGAAPVVNVGWAGLACGVTGYTWQTENAHLTFTPYGYGEPPGGYRTQ